VVVICPDCSRPVRYINAARGEDIYMVDADPVNLIGESGRILMGYRAHKCPEGKGNAESEESGNTEGKETTS
jgi:hypothetical protein